MSTRTATKIRFRKVFWSEVVALLTIAALFLLPLKFSGQWFGMEYHLAVAGYYLVSLLTLAVAQVSYMWPLKGIVIDSKAAFSTGLLLFFGVMAFWLSGEKGFFFHFSQLEH